MAVNPNKISELYGLLPKGSFKDETELATYVKDDASLKEVYGLLPKEYFKDETEYTSYFGDIVKKKIIPLDPMLSAAKGETVLQDFGQPSKEPITPKLPYQAPKAPKVEHQETLAETPTVTSVLNANQKLPSYLKGEQDKIEQETTQRIKDELKSLEDKYKQKKKANPENAKELEKDFIEEHNKLIELRSANIPFEVENLYKKGKDYKFLDPSDVKDISTQVKDITAKPTNFNNKQQALQGLQDSILSKMTNATSEELSAVKRELSDVVAQNSVINDKGVPSVFGWKSEVADRKAKIEKQVASMIHQNGDRREVYPEDMKAYMALSKSLSYFDKILSLPDDDGNFWEGFKSQGRAMATAGIGDLFDTLEILPISQKQQKGEKLTQSEQALLDAYGIFQTASNSEEFGKGYTRGSGIAQSLAFMETFALTGGLAGAGEKTALKFLGNQVKSKVLQNIAKGVGSAVVRAPLLTGGMTTAAQRMTGNPTLTDTGEWKIDPAMVEPTIQAIGKGLYSNFVNALGETAGGWLAGTKVSKFIGGALGIGKIPKSVAKVFNVIGMQPLGELPEEYLTTLMETPVMGDQTLKEAFSPENVWETAVQVGLMSGFFGGIALPSVINENVNRANNKALIDLFGKDSVAALRDAIESNDKVAFSKAMKEAFTGITQENIKGASISEVQRKLVSYANSLAQQKGAKVAQEAAKIANDESTVTTEVGALEVPQAVVDQKAQEEITPILPLPEGFTHEVNIRTVKSTGVKQDRIAVKNDKGEVVSSLDLKTMVVDGETYWEGGSGQTQADYQGKDLMQNVLKLAMENLPEEYKGLYFPGETIQNKTEVPRIFEKLGSVYDVTTNEKGDVFIKPKAKTEGENDGVITETIAPRPDNAEISTEKPVDLSEQDATSYLYNKIKKNFERDSDLPQGLTMVYNGVRNEKTKVDYMKEYNLTDGDVELLSKLKTGALKQISKSTETKNIASQSKESIPLVEEKTDGSTGDGKNKPSLVEKDYELSKETENDALYDLQKGLGFKLGRDYRTIGNTVIRIKDHTPEWGYFTEDIENGVTRVINVTVGDFNNTDVRKEKTTLEQIRKEHPRVEFVDLYVKEGDGINEALKNISEEINKSVTKPESTLSGKPLVTDNKVEEVQTDQSNNIPLSENTPKTEPNKPSDTPSDTNVPPTGNNVTEAVIQGEKDQKQTKLETNSINNREDEVGKIVKDIIDKNPHFYTVVHSEEVIQAAKDLIANEGSVDNAYVKLIKKTRDLYENGENTLPIIHVARQILMQHYAGQLRDLNKMGDKKGADALADRILELEYITQKEVRIAGRTSAFTLWSVLNPEASVFMVEKILRDINKTKLGFEGQEALDFLDTWNNEVPDAVQRLLTENKELKDTIDKLQAGIDKQGDSPRRTTKAKAKELADKVRSLKSSTWGLSFADPTGAVGAGLTIMDGALGLTAQVIERTGNLIQAINDGVTEIKKSSWYKSLSSSKQAEVVKTFRDKVRGAIDFDATEHIEGQSWWNKATKEEFTAEEKAAREAKKEISKEKRDANKRLKEQIYDVIASHWLVQKEGGQDLATKLSEELGLTKAEATKIADIALKSFKAEATKIFEKSFGEKIKKEAKRKTSFEKFFGLIKRGVLNSENYGELFAKEYGIKKNLTQEQRSKLLQLGLNAEAMQPYGIFGDLATNEFLQYMGNVTEADTWVGRQTKLMISANYARMLSGITTAWINVSTSGANIVINPALQVVNIGKWITYIKAFVKGDKQLMRLSNPLIRLYYAFGTGSAYGTGAKIGFNQAMNIVKHGDTKTASKYMESVQNKKGDVIPELEKNKYGEGMRFKGGNWNPFNLMKYSGRSLLAEDSQMFNIPFALELALAARAEAIKGGSTISETALRKKLIDEIQGSFLTDKQARDIETQLAEQVKLLEEQGISPDKRQIQQRRFELTRSLLDLNADILEESEQLARDEIFTGERGGIFSQFSAWVSRVVNVNRVVKIGTMTKVPFTTIVGRIADYSLDTAYGALRARGWSPTGIVARSRSWITTGQFSSFMASPQTTGMFKSAQMGEVGSARYEAQIRRQWAGVVALAVGYALFNPDNPDDDEEGGFDITGALSSADTLKKSKHPLGAYTVQIPLPFGLKIKFRYINYPIMNFPLSLLGNYKDHVRQGWDQDDLNAKFGLVLHSWFHSMTMIKDTSLADGVGELIDLIGGAFSSIKGKSEGEKLKDTEGALEQPQIDKRVTQQLDQMKSEYVQLPLRYIDPIKSNLVQQIWKGITPESRLQGTSWQLLAYNLGLQNIANDKKTDIFGQTIEVYPGDAGIAWPRKEDKRWNKIWKYNVNLTDITAKDRLTIKGRYQTLEWEQFIERKKLANDLFTKKFDDYFDKFTKEELKKKSDTYVTNTAGNKENEIDIELNKVWNGVRTDVNKYMGTWAKQTKENPVIMKQLLEQGALPTFWNEKVKINRIDCLVPYDILEKANDTAMIDFIKKVKVYLAREERINLDKEKVIDPNTKETEFDKQIEFYWKNAIGPQKQKVITELTPKGKKD